MKKDILEKSDYSEMRTLKIHVPTPLYKIMTEHADAKMRMTAKQIIFQYYLNPERK